MTELIKRNMKIYYRDKATVFFSLLTVIITIALYVLFLAELQIDSIRSALNGYEISDKNLNWIINTWITAGLLSIIPVTSSLATLAVIVQDKEKKIMMDFKSMPMKGYKYPLAAIISATIIGTLMSIIAFAGYTFYIFMITSEIFTFDQIALSIALIFLTALSSSTLMGWISTFFKTSAGFSALNIVVATFIGFLNVVYVPFGILPSYIQKIVKFIPTGHIAVLFRNILMRDALDDSFAFAPQTAQITYCKMYAVNFYNENDEIFPHKLSFIFIIALIVVSFILYTICFNRKDKEY